jgi:hypothetical protein
LAGIIPEILSRLCVKCSEEAKEKLLDFVLEIYKSNSRRNYSKISQLFQRLMCSWMEYKVYMHIPDFLSVPIPEEITPGDEDEYPDLFRNIDFIEEDVIDFNKHKIDSSIINELLQKVSSKHSEIRKRAIIRIGCLNNIGLLTEDQREAFGKGLWSQIDNKNNLPNHTYYHKFVFLSLPHPIDINPEIIFLNYIKSEKLLIQKGRNEYSPTHGYIPVFHNIITISERNLFEWSETEINSFLMQLIDWWDTDKEYLNHKEEHSFFGDRKEEFRKRFSNISNMLAIVIIPPIATNPKNVDKENISRLIKELNENNVPCESAKIASILLFPENTEEILMSLKQAIVSSDEIMIKDAFNGLYRIIHLSELNAEITIPNWLFDILVQPIKWRRIPSLKYAINTTIKIIRNHKKFILNQKTITDIIIGLEYLIDETNLSTVKSSINKDDRLFYRTESLALAYHLYDLYKTNNYEIPKVLLKWRDIAQSPEEFGDVRRRWKN